MPAYSNLPTDDEKKTQPGSTSLAPQQISSVGNVAPNAAQSAQAAPGGFGSQASASGTSPGAQSAPGGANVQPQGAGTGFINLQSVMAANAPQAQQMADTLSTNATQMAGRSGAGAITTARGAGGALAGGDGKPLPVGQGRVAGPADTTNVHDADKAQKAQDYANALGSQSGLQSLLQDQYKNDAYTAGQSSLDAFLAGNAGAKQFQQAQSAYGKLGDMVTPTPGPAAKQAPNIKAPTAPAQTPAQVETQQQQTANRKNTKNLPLNPIKSRLLP